MQWKTLMKRQTQHDEDVLCRVPLLANKHYERPSVFDPANLLREARRQKALPNGNVPDICILDPDGDLFNFLRDSGARRNPYWACYHTELYDFILDGMTLGIVGCAVGASFAVLVAEELFASGCRFLISMTSSGQIMPLRQPPYFVLIERALRDEGTSYHYLPPTSYVHIRDDVLAVISRAFANSKSIVQGGVWTTDAPFRETEQSIAFARAEKLLAVEMEAATLYAFAEAHTKAVVLFCACHQPNGRDRERF